MKSLNIIASKDFSSPSLGSISKGQCIFVRHDTAKQLISAGFARVIKPYTFDTMSIKMNRLFNEILVKPIVIVGQGPSSKLLKQHIELFRDKDVIWCSLNRFHDIETDVLSKIDRVFDILWCSSNVRFDETYPYLKDAGKRGTTLMTTTHTSLRIDFEADVYVSDLGIGVSSIFAMLCALGKLRAREIYLIGFDGYAVDTDHVYYGQKKIKDDFISRKASIKVDTILANKIFWDYFRKTVRRTQSETRIHNLKGSRLNCFKMLSIEEMIATIGGNYGRAHERRVRLVRRYRNRG